MSELTWARCGQTGELGGSDSNGCKLSCKERGGPRSSQAIMNSSNLMMACDKTGVNSDDTLC